MRLAASGDEAAFARLWRDNQPPLLRYLRVVAGDNPDDVASEVWLEVARGLERFRGGEGEFRAWLFTLARRRVIDMVRYHARRPVVLTGDPGVLDRRAGHGVIRGDLGASGTIPAGGGAWWLEDSVRRRTRKRRSR